MLMLLGLVAACTPRAAGPEPAAQLFLNSFAEQDFAAAATRTDRPDDAEASLVEVWDGLQAESLTATTTGARLDGDSAVVDYSYEWRLPRDRVWQYTGQLHMGRSGEDWVVRWSKSAVHPQLGDRQTMYLRSDPAPRARVNEHAGSDVLVPGIVYGIAFDASRSLIFRLPPGRCRPYSRSSTSP